MQREPRYVDDVDNNDSALQGLAQHMNQYLQHLPMCGLGIPVLDPDHPGVGVSGRVEGCTCGLAKAWPLWIEMLWADEALD